MGRQAAWAIANKEEGNTRKKEAEGKKATEPDLSPYKKGKRRAWETNSS